MGSNPNWANFLIWNQKTLDQHEYHIYWQILLHTQIVQWLEVVHSKHKVVGSNHYCANILIWNQKTLAQNKYRYFQERHAIACTFTHTCTKVFRSVINCTRKSDFWLKLSHCNMTGRGVATAPTKNGPNSQHPSLPLPPPAKHEKIHQLPLVGGEEGASACEAQSPSPDLSFWPLRPLST